MDFTELECDERFYARLRQRTAVGGVIIFLVPFLLFILVVQFASEHYVRQRYLERLRGAAATNARLLEDVLNTRVAEVNSLARALEQEPPGARWNSAIFDRFAQSHTWFGLILVADSSGRVVRASQGVRGDASACGCLERARGGQPFVTDVFSFPRARPAQLSSARARRCWPKRTAASARIPPTCSASTARKRSAAPRCFS